MTDQKPENNQNPQDPNGNKPQVPQKPQSRGMFGFFAIMLLVLMLVMFLSSAEKGSKLSWREFSDAYTAELIEKDSVILHDNAITGIKLPGETEEKKKLVRVELNTADRELKAQQLNELTGGQFESKSPSGWVQFLYMFGPVLLLIALIWFMLARGMRAAGGGGGMIGSFGKSRHRTMTKEMTGITFKDVAGIEEAKSEVTEIIEFLKNPKRFTRLGGRIPRGVLLAGQPGCGKTLLAKAIAGEADVPFFSISGSDFVEMFVGVGASRVRDLFKQAKESSPCIIFLDEIDAIGRRRGGGFSGGGNDEREQTLNAILVEMDGFASGDGVIVIAATNRPDVLDPALIRPGRFDRQIQVPLPDVAGRLQILKVHAKKVKLGPNVDLEKIARGTPMFSGADLAAIINEGAISATMLDKEFIEHEDLEEARDKVKFGRANKSRVREKEENKLVAYHEAGHAVLQALLKDADPLHKVTIIPRGSAGGATFSLPEKDRMGYSLKWLHATMRVICGGRIAEAKAMDDVSSGASSDIQQVTPSRSRDDPRMGHELQAWVRQLRWRRHPRDVHPRQGLLRRDRTRPSTRKSAEWSTKPTPKQSACSLTTGTRSKPSPMRCSSTRTSPLTRSTPSCVANRSAAQPSPTSSARAHLAKPRVTHLLRRSQNQTPMAKPISLGDTVPDPA